MFLFYNIAHGKGKPNVRRADAVIIATDHSAYDYLRIVKNSALVIDTRNAVRFAARNVVKA